MPTTPNVVRGPCAVMPLGRVHWASVSPCGEEARRRIPYRRRSRRCVRASSRRRSRMEANRRPLTLQSRRWPRAVFRCFPAAERRPGRLRPRRWVSVRASSVRHGGQWRRLYRIHVIPGREVIAVNQWFESFSAFRLRRTVALSMRPRWTAHDCVPSGERMHDVIAFEIAA